MMELYYAPPSPFARKARVVARERGLLDRLTETEVNPYKDDPRLIAANPAGLVPTLVLDDGSAITQSALICEYLDAHGAHGPALLPEGAARWTVLAHTAVANAVLDFAVAVIMEQRKADTPPSAPFIARKMEKITRCLSALPAPSAALDLGGVTTACTLGYLDFRFPDFDWRALRPDLVDWHAETDARPAFAETRPKNQVI